MRRDEYLNKRKSEEVHKIPKDILYELVNQWNAAGFDQNKLLDEDNNWYLREVHWIEAERTNRAFSDMCEFWRKKLNWGINAEKVRWYNRSEAAGILFEQYLYYCVKQDKQVAGNVVVKSPDGRGKWSNAQVFDGWKESTKTEKRKLFVHALAATIMDVVFSFREDITFGGDFGEWFQAICKEGRAFREKRKPHPFIVFGDEPGKAKHYKLKLLGEEKGKPVYETLQPIHEPKKKHTIKEFVSNHSEAINAILSIISITGLIILFCAL